jgi:O-antigen ligase
VQVVNDPSNTPYNAPASDFRELQGRTSVIAFFLGMTIIAAALFLGRSNTFFVSFLAFSLLMTLLWRKAFRPWISLVSISAATPIAIFSQQFTCNFIFALWFAVFNMRYLFRLPKWIYVPLAMAAIGIIVSTINWMSGDIVRNVMRQGAFAINFVLTPFLLIPVAYLRIRESRDHAANLKVLLFYLIVPSTLILVSAKLFGTVANAWEASLHVSDLPEGFLQYRLGNVVVNFLRTEVGFILAALICASTAIAASKVKCMYRLLAGACLILNAFLLLATGSFGSGFACFCGLAAIFYSQFRTVGVLKVLVSLAVICSMLFLTYSFSSPSMKAYLGKRYENRVSNANTDRLVLWARGADQLLQNPEGVGWTLSVGDRVKSFFHNDYLTYAVSYGFIGGLAYTFLIVGLLISFFQVRKSAIDDPSMLASSLAGLGVIVAVAVNSMTDHMTENRWYFNLIWSVIWCCYFCSRPPVQMEPVRQATRSETGIAGKKASPEYLCQTSRVS